MFGPDLNLLVTLDALLSEGSVARAAKRLQLSPSAMSRALARLRETTGDPLLVRAGRGLTPTPRALELRERIGVLVDEAHAVLSCQGDPDLKSLDRTFTFRAGDGFVETFGPALIERLTAEAAGVKLRFAAKPDIDSEPLRDGLVDLETGVVGKGLGPELRAQGLFRDRFVGVVSTGHDLTHGTLTPERYVSGRHVSMWRCGVERGPVDRVLATMGLARNIAVMVGGFSASLALARTTDLIATVPEKMTRALREGLHSFPLPVAVPEITVSLLWHPRMEADPAHRWLRACVRDLCT